MNTPKILLIGRHGNAPKRPDGGSMDELLPESVPEVYERVGKPLHERVLEYEITSGRTFLRHSKYTRTKATGQAVLVGAFDIQPRTGENPPSCQEDLENYDFLDIEISEDPKLKFVEPWTNMKIYKEQGADVVIDFWIANPEAEQHEDEPIRPYNIVSSDCRAVVKENIKRLLSDGKDLGIIVTHGSIVEPCIFTLIDTVRDSPVRKISEIGGAFDMAEFAPLVIEQSPGGVYTAKLRLRDQDYKVDLERL
jgi:hypothetical protein